MWRPETFDVAYPNGPVPKAGYTYRGLGLFVAIEASPKGRRPPEWSLTHLGSGHNVALLKGTVATVFPVATEIAESGDWEFISLFGYKDRFPEAATRLLEIIAGHPKIVRRMGTSGIKDKGRSQAIAQQIASNRP